MRCHLVYLDGNDLHCFCFHYFSKCHFHNLSQSLILQALCHQQAQIKQDNTSLQWLYNQRYNLFCSTGQAFWPFVFQRANIAGKLNFPSFLSLGLKEQYFNKFRKFLRSTCLHFHFDSLSQTFHRRNIHPSESVLQMCNNESYMLKTIIGCSLQNSKGLKYLNIQKAI